MLNKGSKHARIWEAGAAYRLLLIGDKQSPFAFAQAILKFLKEGPGYGLALPRRTLKTK